MQNTHEIVSVNAVPASQKGALPGYEAVCACGFRVSTSLSAYEARRDGDRHVAYMAAKSAPPEGSALVSAPVGPPRPLGSDDSWLEEAFLRLSAAAAPKGRARYTKVSRSDLRLILGQFRALVADVLERNKREQEVSK